jgi:hypothetical protein
MKNGLIPGFEYLVEVLDKDGNVVESSVEKNLIPIVGMNYIVGAITADGGTTPTGSWYIGLLENYTPVAASTMTNMAAQEITGYDEATREAWTHVYDDEYLITNTASKAEFTFSTGDTVYGAFLASSSAKSASTGYLLSAVKFSTARTLTDDGILRITASLTLASA